MHGSEKMNMQNMLDFLQNQAPKLRVSFKQAMCSTLSHEWSSNGAEE